MNSSKVSPAILAVLLIASISAALLMQVTEGANICVEHMGSDCREGECSTKCAEKHRGGYGDCDVGNSCKCFYDCSGGGAKTCRLDLGLYPSGCSFEQCLRDCKVKFPAGRAYCYDKDSYPDQSCRCTHTC